MGRYLVFFFFKRFLVFLISLFALVTICFFLIKTLPGSPFQSDVSLNPVVQAELSMHYGLDLPLYKQYFQFLENLVKGDFGKSIFYEGQSVLPILLGRLAQTSKLAALTVLWVIPLSLLWAFFSLRSDLNFKISEQLSLMITAVPILLLGPVLIYFFVIKIPIFPHAFLSQPLSYVLPSVLLGLKPLNGLFRILKTNMEEVLEQDFIRTAKAKGLSELTIFFKHALRNALGPYVSVVPTTITGLFSGSVVVEIFFSIHGLGLLFVDALIHRDVPLLVGLTTLVGSILIFLQMLSDFFVRYLDPRISE